ncbi:MAG: type II secretion system protein [Thermodesulfobacteriota bacterium]
MTKMRFKPQTAGGFTAIEIIAILVVVGILAVIVISRAMSGATASRVAQESVLKTHIRFAQATSMKQGALWGIKSDGTDYWLFRNNNPDAVANQQPLPGESNVKIRLADRQIAVNAFTVFFDAIGRPYTAYTDVVINTPVSAANPVSITVNSIPASSPVTFGITPETGFMP